MASKGELIPTFDYDPHGDVLHVSIGRDDEPYYVENLDDFLLVQRNLETNEVTGFQVLDVRLHGVENVQAEIREAMAREIRRAEQDRRVFENLIDRFRREDLDALISVS